MSKFARRPTAGAATSCPISAAPTARRSTGSGIRTHRLQDGDEITIGSTRSAVRGPLSGPRHVDARLAPHCSQTDLSWPPVPLLLPGHPGGLGGAARAEGSPDGHGAATSCPATLRRTAPGPGGRGFAHRGPPRAPVPNAWCSWKEPGRGARSSIWVTSSPSGGRSVAGSPYPTTRSSRPSTPGSFGATAPSSSRTSVRPMAPSSTTARSPGPCLSPGRPPAGGQDGVRAGPVTLDELAR